MPQLDEYRRKRRFDRTPEPSGKEAGDSTEPTFVVQKHAARRLHYDFRLAINGTLKSWAVPKGPSLNPADKRLAVMTEDHPLDYANFEGKIPEGSYGAGTVMVWDRGTFNLEGHDGALEQIARGEIKFSLSGEKLRGSFALVKLRNSEKGNDWLMLKHKDASVDSTWNADEHDGSVLTGRTLEEIKEEAPPKRSAAPVRASELQGAKKAPMPASIEPMLPTLVEKAFSDPAWLFELKWDGVRALATIEGDAKGKLKLRARAGADITARYPELATLPEFINARQVILDGEIAALDEKGRGDFEKLQQRMHVRAPSESLISAVPVVFYLFDILYCDGYDLRDSPLLSRKQLLRALLRPSERFLYSDHVAARGEELFELAKQTEIEGIVAKRVDSRYSSGRSNSWLKVKSTKTVDAVIGGWTESPNTGLRFGSLLLGLFLGKKLQFIGHVGSGFDQKLQEEIFAQLKERSTSARPFEPQPKTNEKAFWVSPDLVARVRFTGWTSERSLRNPVFLGLREDKAPEECKWENEIPASPDVITATPAPEVVGRVLNTKALIEAELFEGRQENITIELEGKRFRLSNLNKVYFPQSDYTKRDLIAYYYRVADYILPFLKDRPLVLRRYPDGIKGQAFFQKDVREGLPDWFRTVPIESEGRGGETIHYAIANDKASLLFLTGLGCIDHNPWSSRIQDLEHPDYFFFDLDPSDGTEFSVVVKIARALREKLDELEMTSFVKTSGATGIHIYVPIAEANFTYEQVRTFGEIVARLVGSENRNLITNERTVSKRPAGRVLIDISQNAYGRPLAAPYAVRAFPKAPVSTPISAGELRPTLKPEKLNIKTGFPRLEKHGDLWADFWNRRQNLDRAIELLRTRMPSKATG
jgi:bifunctional non-homologous end joining protein LigD